MNGRVYYLDHIRILLSALVVTVHVALSYAPEVWWFFKSESLHHPWYLYYYEIISTFCMGFFFLISGYFMAAAYQRKGGIRLLRERGKLCLITLILGLAFIVVPLSYLYHIIFRPNIAMNFFDYLFNGFLGINSPPEGWYDRWGASWPDLKFAYLWFMEHILLYTAIYVAFMGIIKKLKIKTVALFQLTWPYLILFLTVISVVTFITRIFFPLDVWGGFLGFIQVEYANFPKYISFVMMGITFYSCDVLENIPRKMGIICFTIGILLLSAALVGVGRVPFLAAQGGYHYDSLLWSIYDCVMNTCTYIGVMVVAREYFNRESRITTLLAKGAFGVYLLHVPVLVFIQLLLVNNSFNLVERFMLENVLGILVSYFISISFLKIHMKMRRLLVAE